MNEFKNKTILITGSSSGIGETLAKKLDKLGAKLILTARSEDKLKELKTEIQKQHNVSVDVFSVDLSLKNSAEKLTNFCDKIDILVNNAGAIPPGNLSDTNEDLWRESWDLKVFGYINLSRLMYDKMKKQNHGVILNIIGSAGQKPNYNYIAGSTGNAGLMHFTKSLAAGSCNDGIRVLAINPGLTASDRMVTMMRSQAEKKLGDPDRREELLKDLPFERAAKSKEVADLTTFLVSPRCSYISGTVITIDGGHSNQ